MPYSAVTHACAGFLHRHMSIVLVLHLGDGGEFVVFHPHYSSDKNLVIRDLNSINHRASIVY